MRPIVTYVAWSVWLCVLVTTVSRTKADEPIEAPFGLWTQVDPRSHVFGGDTDPQG